MAQNKKALEWALHLQDELRIRAARFATALAVTGSQDTSGNPLIIVGTVSAPGGAGVTIRIRPITWPNVQTSVGLPQEVYGPHVFEIVYEAGIAADTVEVLSTIEILCALRGAQVQIYNSPNGTAADYTQFIAANLVSTFVPSMNFGLVGGM